MVDKPVIQIQAWEVVTMIDMARAQKRNMGVGISLFCSKSKKNSLQMRRNSSPTASMHLSMSVSGR